MHCCLWGIAGLKGHGDKWRLIRRWSYLAFFIEAAIVTPQLSLQHAFIGIAINRMEHRSVSIVRRRPMRGCGRLPGHWNNVNWWSGLSSPLVKIQMVPWCSVLVELWLMASFTVTCLAIQPNRPIGHMSPGSSSDAVAKERVTFVFFRPFSGDLQRFWSELYHRSTPVTRTSS